MYCFCCCCACCFVFSVYIVNEQLTRYSLSVYVLKCLSLFHRTDCNVDLCEANEKDKRFGIVNRVGGGIRLKHLRSRLINNINMAKNVCVLLLLLSDASFVFFLPCSLSLYLYLFVSCTYGR